MTTPAGTGMSLTFFLQCMISGDCTSTDLEGVASGCIDATRLSLKEEIHMGPSSSEVGNLQELTVRLVKILAVEIGVPRTLLPAASTILGSYSFTNREREYIEGIPGPDSVLFFHESRKGIHRGHSRDRCHKRSC